MNQLIAFGAGLLTGVASTIGAIAFLLRLATDPSTDPAGDRREA